MHSFPSSLSRQTLILSLTTQLAKIRTMEEVIDIVRLGARELIGSDGVTFVLRDGNFCHYVDENAIGPLWKGMRFPINSCISGWAMLHKESVCIEDIYTDSRIPLDAYRSTFVRSLIMAPIQSQDPVGAIGAYWQDKHVSTEEEIGFLKALADTTAVAIQNVLLLQALAAESDRKDRFIAMLAHELRNPLAPISNGIQLLKRLVTPAPMIERVFSGMDRQVRQMTKLVDGLLDSSRISHGKLALEVTQENVVELARSALEDFEERAKASNITFSVTLPSRPLLAKVDPIRFAQILSNLVDNAFKFTEAGGEVQVVVSPTSSSTFTLSVRDSGIGIDPKDISSIFEAFVQADRSLDRHRGGLGLGLSLVKQLVELHQGSVEVKSRGIGFGTEFIVEMPLDSETIDDVFSSVEKKMKRILVVEDNFDSAQTLRDLLEVLGYEVVVAEDGLMGVECAQEWKPDVIICDIGLPKLNGFEVAKRLKAAPECRHSLLLALSGYTTQEDKDMAQQSGFSRHFAKPVDFDLLLEEIQSHSQYV